MGWFGSKDHETELRLSDVHANLKLLLNSTKQTLLQCHHDMIIDLSLGMHRNTALHAILQQIMIFIAGSGALVGITSRCLIINMAVRAVCKLLWYLLLLAQLWSLPACKLLK